MRATIAEIRTLTRYDCRSGTTIRAIPNALEALGLQTLSVEVTFPVLQGMLNRNIPAVIGYGDAHVAVILPPYKNGRILLVDATMLRCEYVAAGTFRRHWDGTAIFVRPHDSASLLETAEMLARAETRRTMSAALPPLVGLLVLLGVKRWRLPHQVTRGGHAQ